MSVGAKRALDSPHDRFHGCLENLLYNGVDLVELARQRDQRVTAQVNSLTTPSIGDICCHFAFYPLVIFFFFLLINTLL